MGQMHDAALLPGQCCNSSPNHSSALNHPYVALIRELASLSRLALTTANYACQDSSGDKLSSYSTLLHPHGEGSGTCGCIPAAGRHRVQEIMHSLRMTTWSCYSDERLVLALYNRTTTPLRRRTPTHGPVKGPAICFCRRPSPSCLAQP